MSSSSGNDTGIGFFGLLTIVFIVLKLTGYIDWSWFWVLSPILIPIIIFIGGALIFAILFIKEGFKKWFVKPVTKMNLSVFVVFPEFQ